MVGESGSGKSLTALAVSRLLEHPAQVSAAEVTLLGRDVLAAAGRGRAAGAMSDRELRRFLGTKAGLVFQDPMTSFNPVKRVGAQLAEVAAVHHGLSRRQAGARAVDRLRAVRIPRPEHRARQFPHELSGGMRQRAMIGMAVMGEPALVIADEPTTALDVTVQRQVLRLLKSIQADGDMALLFISHDITVVGQVCDRVLVMYAGKIVENLPVGQLTDASHPYTRALLAAVPSMQTPRDLPLAVIPGRPADPANLPAGCAFAARCAFASDRCREQDPPLVADPTGREVACWHVDAVLAGAPTAVAGAEALTADPESAGRPQSAGRQHERACERIRKYSAFANADSERQRGGLMSELRFENLTVRYGTGRHAHVAADGVDLVVPSGHVVGLVGESGSGKSTLARAAVGLVAPTAGKILLDGKPVPRRGRRPLQMVFQDPYASLDPRMTAGESIAEAIGRGAVTGRSARRDEAARLTDLVGLPPGTVDRFPGELSGGQRQRVALARALAGRPDVIIADEITSALDVSTQGAVLNLVRELQRELSLSMLFISHNLAVVRYVADYVAVMYQGRIVEHGPAERVLLKPEQPYTRQLLAAVPRPGTRIDVTADGGDDERAAAVT